jgi:hypothetical protein
MDQFKWGGRFMGLDRVARAPVSGVVTGTFDGTFSPEAQPTLSALILRGFNELLGELPTTLSEACNDLEELSRTLTQHVAGKLTQHGASGQVTLTLVRPQ